MPRVGDYLCIVLERAGQVRALISCLLYIYLMSIPQCLTLCRTLTSLGLSLLSSKWGLKAFILPLFLRTGKGQSEIILKKTL